MLEKGSNKNYGQFLISIIKTIFGAQTKRNFSRHNFVETSIYKIFFFQPLVSFILNETHFTENLRTFFKEMNEVFPTIHFHSLSFIPAGL